MTGSGGPLSGRPGEWQPSSALIAGFYRAHRERSTGSFRMRRGEESSRVILVRGSPVAFDGVHGLLELLGKSASPGSGRLNNDMKTAMDAGVPYEEALLAAGTALGNHLAGLADHANTEWCFRASDLEVPTSFRLGPGVAQFIAMGLEKQRSLEGLIDLYRGRVNYQVAQTGLAAGVRGGMPAACMKGIELAAGQPSLQRFVDLLSGGDARLSGEAWRTADLLIQLELVSLSDRRPEQSVRSVSARPEVEKDTGATVKQLREFLAEIQEAHPLAAMGFDPDDKEPITVSRLRGAFRDLARKYHPDRISSGVEEVRVAAEDIFTVLNEIREELEEPEILKKAVRSFQREYGEREITELDRQRARVMERLANSRMQHRSWKAARDLWVQALEITPDEPLFLLRERFCRAVLKEVPYGEAAVEIADMDLKVERELATGERGKREVEKIYRVGWLWKLAGDEAQALSNFRRAVELDPAHREAQREVRLYDRRTQQASGETQKRRGFGSLLRRKKD